MKKPICLLLAVICLVSCCYTGALAAGTGSLANFDRVNTYQSGQFADVKDSVWYSQSVAAAYELGLMKGQSNGSFNPDGNVTLAETVALAARLHCIYTTGTANFVQGSVWYRVYVNYALRNGIIKAELSDYTVPATRAQFAEIMSCAMPETALEAINTIEDGSIPDVKSSNASAPAIYRLYRAGILTGNNSRGTFTPDTNIARSAVAAMVTRIADSSLRVKFALAGYTGPDLTEQPAADDAFFSDAAILGNSLVEGLRLYSKLSTLTYYSVTSMTVYSASNTKNVVLSNGSYGSQLDAMAQKQYGKVYIELGINEIGNDVDYFIELYGAMLDRIIKDQPAADIYVMAITPVSKEKSESSNIFNMDRIKKYNDALYKLAKDKKCYYLDDFTPLIGSDGYLAPADTWDGVHLAVDKYSSWENCIRTHYAG